MPPPVLERDANPKIREDRAVQDIRQNSEKMHRATSEDAHTTAWFYCYRSVFPQFVRNAGPDVDFSNVSTYQCSILFNNMGSCNRKSECRKAENIDKPIPSNEKYHVTSDPHDTNEHAAIFEVKFGKTSERAVRESRDRSAEQLFADLESVASAVEGSDLGPTEDPFEPTASCIYDLKKRQPVTRSGPPRLKCCVCNLHHKRAMSSRLLLFENSSEQCFNR